MGRPRKAGTGAIRDPLAVKIGGRIAEARKAKKWKLRDLALHANLELKRLGNYETGERMPGPAEILSIGTALGESPAFLMCLTDDQNPDEARNSAEATLLQLYRIVDPKDRSNALERLGAMAFLKKDAIQDAQLEHLSAKGKPLDAAAGHHVPSARKKRSTARSG